MQQFIENAIWHGLNTKGSKGNLIINVFEKNSNLVCEIDDAGVGKHQKKEVLLLDKKISWYKYYAAKNRKIKRNNRVRGYYKHI